VKTTLLFLLILLVTLANAATFNRSTGNGLASDGTKWSTGVSPCGSGGDGVFVVVQTNIALNCTLGSSATGLNSLRIEAGGSIYSYDGTHSACAYTSTQGNLTLYLASNGTNPIGSGSVTNPGSDATASGVFMAYGTFCYQGDASDQLTLTAANGTSPIYVVHEWDSYSGGIGIGTTGETGGAKQAIHGAVFTCYYCKLVNLGSSSFPTAMEGLAYSLKSTDVTPTSSLDMEHSEFDSPYEFTQGNVSAASNNNWTMKYDWFNGPTSQYGIKFTAAGIGGTFINNTETGATTAGQMIEYLAVPGVVTWQGNVSVGNSEGTIQRGQVSNGFQGGPLTIRGNLCLNAEGPVSGSDCWSIKFASNDTTSTMGGNMCWGSNQCYEFRSPSGSSSGPTISNNWGAIWKEASAGQGVFESYGSWFVLKNNIAILENDNNNVIVLLYSGSEASGVYQVDNMTIYAVTKGLSTGIDFGDTSGLIEAVASPSWFRSSLIVNSYGGLMNNTNNHYAGQCDGSTVGLCNNLVYSTTVDYCGAAYLCASHGTGAGYDDGIHNHPNVLYGDIPDATNPQFIDPTRRPTGYSTQCGGEGTIADLGTQYSYRDGLGATYNSCYDTSKMLLWLQIGFMPLNQKLAQAGFGRTFVGAIPPLSIIGIH